MPKPLKPNTFIDRLALGLLVFSGYGLFITFILIILAFLILPLANFSLEQLLASNGQETLPMINTLTYRIKMGLIAFFIYLFMILASSIQLRRNRSWAPLVTFILLLIPTFFLGWSLFFAGQHWGLFGGLPLPFWLWALSGGLIMGLILFLVGVMIKLLLSWKANARGA